jgi:carboxypeptidase C (cathepsin A)
VIDYFNNASVKAALKINAAYLQDTWQLCNETALNYTRSSFGSAWIYMNLRGKGYKMLKYSGDTDSFVPTLGTQQWITEMGWKVTKEWAPYFIPVTETTKKVAGYVEIRDDFTFATVHGAGSLASRQKRQQTAALVTRFISGVDI